MKYVKPFDLLDYLEVVAWVCLLIVPFLVSIGYWLTIPTIFILFKCLQRFSIDKKDLKNARNYFRVKKTSWLHWLNFVFLGWTILIQTPYNPELKSPEFLFCLIPIIGCYIFFNMRLSNFTSGFRWYISGIKLPGRRKMIIPWRHVSEVRREEGKLYITVLDKEKIFKIHKSDRRDAEAFVRHYERLKSPKSSY